MAVAERYGAPDEVVTPLREAYEADIGPDAVEVFRMLKGGENMDGIKAVLKAHPEVGINDLGVLFMSLHKVYRDATVMHR